MQEYRCLRQQPFSIGHAYMEVNKCVQWLKEEQKEPEETMSPPLANKTSIDRAFSRIKTQMTSSVITISILHYL